MDVSRGQRWGAETTTVVHEADVVADQVEIRVETEVVEASRARQAAGGSSAVDDLVGCGGYVEGGSEWDGASWAFGA